MTRHPSELRYCETCGKEMWVEYNRLLAGRGRYCSRACASPARAEKWRGAGSPGWKGGSVARTCTHCGKEFAIPPGSRGSRGRYCSTDCRAAHMAAPVDRVCEACAQPFTSIPSAVAGGKARWCSKACRAVAQSTRQMRPCDQCGTPVAVRGTRLDRPFHFCGRRCAGLHRRTIGEYVCRWCQQTFRPSGTSPASKHLHCSPACREADSLSRKTPCLECGTLTTNKQYCSFACVTAAKSVIVACETCGVEMKHWRSRRAAGKGRYCSKQCFQRATAPAWPIPTSKLEQRVRSELDRRGISYQTGVQLYPYWPDLLFAEARLIVEIDGDYWHNRPGRAEADQIRDAALAAQGWRTLRIWEHEVKRDLPACIDRIQQALWHAYLLEAA